MLPPFICKNFHCFYIDRNFSPDCIRNHVKAYHSKFISISYGTSKSISSNLEPVYQLSELNPDQGFIIQNIQRCQVSCGTIFHAHLVRLPYSCYTYLVSASNRDDIVAFVHDERNSYINRMKRTLVDFSTLEINISVVSMLILPFIFE